MSTPEFFALLSTFVVSSFALVRFSFLQHRTMVERFVTYLEEALQRQEEVNACVQPALEELVGNVKENSRVLSRVAERLQVQFTDARRPS